MKINMFLQNRKSYIYLKCMMVPLIVKTLFEFNYTLVGLKPNTVINIFLYSYTLYIIYTLHLHFLHW